MRVFIQRSRDRLFLKTKAAWVSSKDQARAFANCGAAIDYCVEGGLEGVRLWLGFDDARYDMPLEVFRAETKALIKYNHELRERTRRLVKELDNHRAENKERKRAIAFRPARGAALAKSNQ